MPVFRHDYRSLPYRWSDDTVTWSFADYHIPSDDRQRELGDTFLRDGSDGMRGMIRDAFEAWEAVCGIDFVEVDDSASSDIRIAWTSDSYSDGPGGSLAYFRAWTWTADPDEISQALIAVDRADSGVPLDQVYDTVLHEVGHAVGLEHSDVANVVMSGGLGSEPGGLTPYWRGVPGRDPLQADDIAGARALWGEPRGGSTPGPAPTGAPTAGPDLLAGTSSADTMLGGAGDDTILAYGGNDAVLGGPGMDVLWGGAGRDTLWGGADPDTLDGGSGGDLLYGLAGDDFISGAVSLSGGESDGNDVILAGTGADTLSGGAGNDLLFGEGGNDVLFGGPGADFLAGGGGDDHIQAHGLAHSAAGSGTPTLYDYLDGGRGATPLREAPPGTCWPGGRATTSSPEPSSMASTRGRATPSSAKAARTASSWGVGHRGLWTTSLVSTGSSPRWRARAGVAGTKWARTRRTTSHKERCSWRGRRSTICSRRGLASSGSRGRQASLKQDPLPRGRPH